LTIAAYLRFSLAFCRLSAPPAWEEEELTVEALEDPPPPPPPSPSWGLAKGINHGLILLDKARL
jgi:hypothetical protein